MPYDKEEKKNKKNKKQDVERVNAQNTGANFDANDVAKTFGMKPDGQKLPEEEKKKDKKNVLPEDEMERIKLTMRLKQYGM